MAAPIDRPMRVASDFLNSAANQQLDRRARLGREVSSQDTVSYRRVAAAMAGRLSLQDLTPEESVAFNAEIEVELERRISSTNLQDVLRSEGVRVAVLGDAGEGVSTPA